MGCWETAGKPSVINPKTIEAAKLIDDVYEETHAGGYLHVAVDDWNLEDHSLAFCKNCVEENSEAYTEESIEAQTKCLNALTLLTTEERYSAMAIHNGFIKTDEASLSA